MKTTAFLENLRLEYLGLHTRKEDLFWEVKMGLAADADAGARNLAEAELAYQSWLQDPARIAAVREAEGFGDGSAAEQDELHGWRRLFSCYTLEDPQARALSAEILALESELQRKRAAMELCYIDPTTGQKVRASTNKLALLVANDPSEAVRKAAIAGLYDVERFVLQHGFLEIVKLRNRLGRMLGYEDYYDWKVAVAEGQRKRAIFARLEHFLAATEASTQRELARFAAEHGASALEPYNFGRLRKGALSEQLDPYFPFSRALERWGRSFAAMGIKFRGAALTLDLVDRVGKYENGFMHGPGPAWFDHGEWRPARINFTANAVPGAIGSGLTAATTLFHEGGHAAHFANILAGSPCWSVEFPPTSVAYAETQSMFLDSLLGDADWRARYAATEDGAPLPWAMVERQIRDEQPFRGWETRRLITVPMGERMLYEVDETELTPDRVLEKLRDIERRTQGLNGSARPILAVPHLISAESSAYYHAYILAEMAVYQTRAFFLARDGHLTDNPRIGPDLASAYWAPGNRVTHDDTLVALTGSPLSADALIAESNMTVDEALADARRAWDRAQSTPAYDGAVELDARLKIVHGAEVIGDTAVAPFDEVASAFRHWVGGLR
jgi:hypothetical protein